MSATTDMALEAVIKDNTGNVENVEDFSDIAINLSAWISAVGEENIEFEIKNMDDLKAKFPFIASKLSQFAEDKSWNELVSFSEKIYDITQEDECVSWEMNNQYKKIDAFVKSRIEGTAFEFEGIGTAENWLNKESFIKSIADDLEKQWSKEDYAEYLKTERDTEVKEKLTEVCLDEHIDPNIVKQEDYEVVIDKVPTDFEEVVKYIVEEALSQYSSDEEVDEETVRTRAWQLVFDDKDYKYLSDQNSVNWSVRLLIDQNDIE
ncbi:hypothetical protein [Enterococcus faecium]|uniref:hypothetical protein n=5 Tax=Enterococcus faecium TaxID=1352 RepID=UPI000A7304FB|nr:hypothetical protein [Enterococcus faecium]